MESDASGRLLERDLLFALDAVLRINAQTDMRSLQEETLSCIRALIPCTQAMFFSSETDASGARKLRRPVTMGVPARYFDEFLAGGYHEDAYFQGMYLSAQNRAFRDSDIMPESYRTSTRVYREVFEKQGIHFALRSPIVHDGVVLGSLSLFSAREEGDFSKRDAALLDVLVPHIAQRMALLEEDARIGREPFGAGRMAGILTPREREVVSLIASGMSDVEIAERLRISRLTLKKHVSNMYRKLDVGSRTQLLAALRDAPGGYSPK